MIYRSYNEFHLGDNLIHLNFLRRMAIANPQHEFEHYMHPCHMEALVAIADVPKGNLLLGSLESSAFAVYRREKPDLRNVWKNSDGFWERHIKRNDWAEFHVEWFSKLASEMVLQSEIRTTRDLLLNYPGIVNQGMSVTSRQQRLLLNYPAIIEEPSGLTQFRLDPFDVLFVNSNPCSGQFMDFDSEDCLDPMIAALIANGLRVITTKPSPCKAPCTRDYGLSITQIGKLSLTTPYHVMVATGPMWPTFNVWNTLTTKLRLVMLQHEVLNFPVPTIQAATRAEAWRILEKEGLL